MSSNAGIVLHGRINASHTTNMNAQFAPRMIPTPWPLVVFSVLLSFVICVAGTIVAMRSIDPKYVPPPPKVRMAKTSKPWFKSKAKSTATTTSSSTTPSGAKATELQPIPASTKTTGVSVSSSPLKSSTSRISWSFPTGKIIYYLTALYCTFRAVSGFMIGLYSLHDSTTPVAAPSVILLALISTQIMYANMNHSPLTRLILALDVLALAITFGMTGYAPNRGNWWPRYATMHLEGDNCAVYAGDCMSQAPQWISVGCGDYKKPTNFDNGVSFGYYGQFYLPYANTGNLNVKASMNPLHATEMTVIVFGTIWWIFVIMQLIDFFATLADLFAISPSRSAATTPLYQQHSLFSRLKSLFSFSFTRQPRARKPATSYQTAITTWICVGGLFLAFLVMLMGIGGHTSQMMKKQKTMYLESFGEQVGANFTRSANGVITGSEYWGNETNWSDCFEVRAPGSRSGFWREWVDTNREGGALFRIAAGL